jgi:flagellar FliJ protein
MPGKFQFNLQRVLDYRTQLEEQAKLGLAQARRNYQEQSQYLDRLRARLADLDEREAAKTDLDPAELWLARNYRQGLKQDIETGRRKLAELARVVDKKRREVVERSKDRKLLEKLKSNKALEFAREESNREQRENDDLATIRYRQDAL